MSTRVARARLRAASDPAQRKRLPSTGLVRVGRDPGADLELAGMGISRQHAIIQAPGDGHWLEDLGSANGTRLNGKPLTSRARLSHGDEIEFGGESTWIYETSAPAPHRVALVTAALLAVVAAALATARLLPIRNDALARAVTEARAAIEADRQGDPTEVKGRLRAAMGILYQSGYLDDAPPGAGARRAFELLQPRLGNSIDLARIFQHAVEASRPVPPPAAPVPSEPRPCRLDTASAAELTPCLRRTVKSVLADLRQQNGEVPDWFYLRVGRKLRKERAFLETSLERGRELVPMLESELEAARLPPALHYLALIESGYRKDAGSPKGAVGLWQFMPATARQYALRVDAGVDERRDPRKSTRAAAQYLRDLTFEFGGDALLLALAGYNRGENAVRSALKRLDDPFSDRSLWALVERRLLPAETVDYVPRFMAAAVAGRAGLPSGEVLREAGY